MPEAEIELRPYILRAEGNFRVQRATQILTQQCMARFGLDYAVGTGTVDTYLARERESDKVIYGIADAATARRYGYSPTKRMLDHGKPPPANEDSPEYNRVLQGTDFDSDVPKSPGSYRGKRIPGGGCLGEAREILWGTSSYLAQDDLGNQISLTSWQEALDSSTMQAKFDEWTKCMKAAGYKPVIESGQELDPGRFPLREDGSQAPADEVKFALADLECRERTRLVQTWIDEERQRNIAAIKKNKAELEKQRTHLESVLAKADAVMAGGASGLSGSSGSPSE